MSIRFAEKPKTRDMTFSTRTQTREYTCSGTIDASQVMSIAYSGTPAILADTFGPPLFRQDIAVSCVNFDVWNVTVPYGPAPIIGQFRLNFDTTGGTLHVTSSRQTIAAYGKRLNGNNATVNDHKGMIGVTTDGVEGVDIVIPSLKLTVEFQHDIGVIGLARIKQLARNVGKMNSDVFLTFAPGEVLFLGMTGTEGTNTPTSVSYQFACSENATGLTIGSAISDIEKRGHDYIWIQYQDKFVDQTPVKQPLAAYVERVYAATPFVPLFGFGA